MDTGNTTRRLTPRELELLAQELDFEEELRILNEQMKEVYVDCSGDSCATEVTPVGKSSALLVSTMMRPGVVDATATAITVSLSEGTGVSAPALSRGRILVPNAAMATAVVS